MKILGINQVPGMLAWTHDSAAALIIDGTLIATAEEERFNRLRHTRGYPHRAVEYVLSEGNIQSTDVDVVAISYDPWQFIKHPLRSLNPRTLFFHILNLGAFLYFKRGLCKERFPNARVMFIPHHRAHAASTYRTSGYGEANIMILDGSGETETFTLFVGQNGRINKLWDIPLDKPFGGSKNNSIGLMYTSMTGLLGLGVQAEGKTMGLASWGSAHFDLSSVFSIQTHTRFTIDRKALAQKYGSFKRGKKDPITQDHKDLAASLQKALEEAFVHLGTEAYATTGIRNFCLAGGVALNCNSNSALQSASFCDALFVQPGSNDSGAALGAALEASAQCGDAPDHEMQTAYWGPEFSDAYIAQVIATAKVKARRFEEIEIETAKLLSEGKIVGWLQGRMELGPRALCNRSILANPTIEGMNDRVNIDIKHREVWRPFAPVVLEDEATTYFEGARRSPFMLLTYMVKPAYRHILPAITHIDGSSRIQTVTDVQNPRCARLLREFKKLSGHPILMNTSFNDAGEPIVCTPQDALRCYFSTGLDALVMGNYLLTKVEQ